MQVPRSGWQIPVAKITGQGLTSIAILVALLWTCAIGELLVAGRTRAGFDQVMRDLRELRLENQRKPAAAPARPPHRRAGVAVG
jgi:hypothetical protein